MYHKLDYLYFLDFGDYQIIGASPESLVSVKDGIVTTNPIAGTRPRGVDELEDDALAVDLLADKKEVAEEKTKKVPHLKIGVNCSG